MPCGTCRTADILLNKKKPQIEGFCGSEYRKGRDRPEASGRRHKDFQSLISISNFSITNPLNLIL